MNLGLLSIVAKGLFSGRAIQLPSGRSVEVTHTPLAGLRKVSFSDDQGNAYTALEQNPATGSRWASLASSGREVVQFKQGSKYVAVSIDGVVKPY